MNDPRFVSAVVAVVTGAVMGLSGAEFVSISVAIVTSGAVAFASLMQSRAKKYETNLSREEAVISRIREDNKELRSALRTCRSDRDRDGKETDMLEVRLVAYMIGVRLLTAQLTQSGLVPSWTSKDIED